MTDKGFQVARIDELEELPVNGESSSGEPVRRRFGITAFGIERLHARTRAARDRGALRDAAGHQELYVVLRGRATLHARRRGGRRARRNARLRAARHEARLRSRPRTGRGARSRRRARRGLRALPLGVHPSPQARCRPGRLEKAREIMDAAMAARAPRSRGLLQLRMPPSAERTNRRRRSPSSSGASSSQPKSVRDYAGERLRPRLRSATTRRVLSESPGRRTPAASARSAGTGSPPAARRRAPRRARRPRAPRRAAGGRPRARTPCAR